MSLDPHSIVLNIFKLIYSLSRVSGELLKNSRNLFCVSTFDMSCAFVKQKLKYLIY